MYFVGFGVLIFIYILFMFFGNTGVVFLDNVISCVNYVFYMFFIIGEIFFVGCYLYLFFVY